MMRRYFHLYPDGPDQQRLRLSMSLVDIHCEPGFNEAIAPYNVEVSEATEKLVPESWQELVIRPPIPPESAEKFGAALVEFAYQKGRDGPTSGIGFLDHTQGVSDPFSTQQIFEKYFYGHVLTVEELEQRLDFIETKIMADPNLDPFQRETMLRYQREVVEERRRQELVLGD